MTQQEFQQASAVIANVNKMDEFRVTSNTSAKNFTKEYSSATLTFKDGTSGRCVVVNCSGDKGFFLVTIFEHDVQFSATVFFGDCEEADSKKP
jgi:hypothetical protein